MVGDVSGLGVFSIAQGCLPAAITRERQYGIQLVCICADPVFVCTLRMSHILGALVESSALRAVYISRGRQYDIM